MNSTYAASKLCRACLSDHEDMQDIFQICFAEVFEYCTSLQVSMNDGLPTALCRNCVSLLNTSYYFKQQCIRSDETLKQIIIAPQANNSHDSPTDLKYEDACQPNNSAFSIDKYSQTLLTVEPLPPLALDHYDQHLQDAKVVTPIEETLSNEDLKCDNYNVLDVKCSYNPNDLITPCDTQENAYTKDVPAEHNHTNDDKFINKDIVHSSPVLEKLLTKKTKPKSKNTIKCPKCEKIFKSPHRLDAHIREHYGLKPFVCKICQKEFSNWRTLRMHSNKHAGKRNYQCNVCKKGFTYPTALEVHKKIHSNIRKYSCSKCDSVFVQSSHLKAHMSTHSTEQPYSCIQCHKLFKTSANLKSHMERHKGVKNFVCSICGKSFPTNGELTTHMRSHNTERKYQCIHCKKAYKQKSLLTSHLRVHSGELPFKCTVCSRRFKDSQILKRHSVTHSDLKTHVCPLCNKCFGYKTSLNKHSKAHNKELQGVVFEFIDETVAKDI